MLNATNKTLTPRNMVRRKKPRAVRQVAQDAQPQPGFQEKFATALLAGNRREMDRILREIAEVYPPSESPAEFLELMSDLLARTAHQALKLQLMRQELRNLTLTDDLTGLHNRRGFLALAGQNLKFARRNHEQALLFFADINGLKKINDRFGHAEGDAAIQRIARVLERTFRDSDVIARLSGDEFAVLANEAGPDSPRDILRRLKENLQSEAAREPRYLLSLSIGVARFDPRSPITLDELLHSADQAMYEAKRSRRGDLAPATLAEARAGKENRAPIPVTPRRRRTSAVPVEPQESPGAAAKSA